MDRVKTIKLQEMVDFINQQKPDRKLDFRCWTGKGIGCLLTQYCRKKFKNKVAPVGYFSCVLHKGQTTYNITSDTGCSYLLLKAANKNFCNYAQLQKLVKEEFN